MKSIFLTRFQYFNRFEREKQVCDKVKWNNKKRETGIRVLFPLSRELVKTNRESVLLCNYAEKSKSTAVI